MSNTEEYDKLTQELFNIRWEMLLNRKNPEVQKELYEKLKMKRKEIAHYKFEQMQKERGMKK